MGMGPNNTVGSRVLWRHLMDPPREHFYLLTPAQALKKSAGSLIQKPWLQTAFRFPRANSRSENTSIGCDVSTWSNVLSGDSLLCAQAPPGQNHNTVLPVGSSAQDRSKCGERLKSEQGWRWPVVLRKWPNWLIPSQTGSKDGADNMAASCASTLPSPFRKARFRRRSPFSNESGIY